MKKASKLQREVFEYIVDCIVEKGGPPTYRQIQSHFGAKSKNSIDQIMLALKNKDFLEVKLGRYGGIQIYK